jgi:hypothetical protein
MQTKPTMKTLLPTIVLAVLAFATEAAEIRPIGANQPGCDTLGSELICASVLISGKLVDGDSARLDTYLKRVDQSLQTSMPIRVGLVLLDSPGGSVSEAMRIGKIIRKRQIGTFVTGDSTCASSCVLVLAAGVKRAAAGKVLIHSFYTPEFLGTGRFEDAERAYRAVQRTVEQYLDDMRVPRALLDEMRKVPHTTAKSLTLEETVELGLLGIDPVYAQTRPK